METFLTAVWDTILDDIKESITDPESRNALRNVITEAIVKHKSKLPSVGGGVPLTKNVGITHTTTKKAVTSAYHLHWNEWKEKNKQKDWTDPADSSKKLTPHKYWKTYIWDVMDEDEKAKYQAIANRNKVPSKKTSTKKEGKKINKTAYSLFLEKMKMEMKDYADATFNHPETGETVKLHKFLLSVWSNYIKKNPDLKEPFDTKAKEIKESGKEEYVLDDISYIDPEKLLNYDYDNLELINFGLVYRDE